MPELSKAIDFDPEGSMFCAYSSKVDALAQICTWIERVCDDTNTMKDLFSRAELDQLTKISLNFKKEQKGFQMKLPEVVEQLEKHPDLHLYLDKKF